MNPKLITVIILAVLAAIFIAPRLTSRKTRLALRSAGSLFCSGLRENFATANVETATGTDKVFTRRADAAHTYTHLLVKTGSDAFHVAVAGAADRPFGSTSDAPDNAEDIVHVDPLERTDSSRRLRCATALAADIDVYTAANGFVQGEPTTAGVYWLVGRTAALAVQEASGLYTVQVVTRAPVKLTVIAAATGTAATDIAAIFAAIGTPTLLKHA
jgi:hypothetical protein